MNNAQGQTTKGLWMVAIVIVISIGATGCTSMGMPGLRLRKPAQEEFGLGPRVSSEGHYKVVLQPEEPLRARKLQSVEIVITDADGKVVEGASIAISGGMPQHGHGLPTRPQVTASLGDGRYQLEGLRFNMGGWWELKLAIDAANGRDEVTFNLAL